MGRYKDWRIRNLLGAREDILLEIIIQDEAGNVVELHDEEQKLEKIETKLHKLGWFSGSEFK